MVDMSQKNNSLAKDFFLHLGLIVALYTTVISFLNLIFRVINIQFPQVESYYRYSYYNSGSPLSMPVATLIVFLPLFLYFSHLVYKSYKEDAQKKELAIRKWLLSITLFIAGLVFAGDLVTVLYYFLDGRELTAGFLLKALTLFITAGLVFVYYLKDFKDDINKDTRKKWAISVTVIILLSIVLGFAALGSPRSQRLLREDREKVMTLENIESNIRYYVQNVGELPESLDDVYDSVYAYSRPEAYNKDDFRYYIVDKEAYEFQLCTVFNLPTEQDMLPYEDPWRHEAGEHCFTKTVQTNSVKPVPVVEPLPF